MRRDPIPKARGCRNSPSSRGRGAVATPFVIGGHNPPYVVAAAVEKVGGREAYPSVNPASCELDKPNYFVTDHTRRDVSGIGIDIAIDCRSRFPLPMGNP